MEIKVDTPKEKDVLTPPRSDTFPKGDSSMELSRQASSKSPLVRVLSGSSTFAEDGKSFRPKFEFRATPRRLPRTSGKDITDVRQMEQGLLQLLSDFHSGKLQAFGKDCTFEKMENVREQQERLARLHFDLNAQQELCGSQSEEGRRLAKENLSKLIETLQELSHSIEQLQSNAQGVQTDV